MKKDKIRVFMCKKHYLWHIPDDINGVKVFFSKRDIVKNMPCVKNCDIIECELTYVKEHKGEDDEICSSNSDED